MSLDDSLLDVDSVQKTSMKEFSYPLLFEFKISSMVNDFTVKDANGKTLTYVRQKMFKLKEAVSVFADDSRNELLYKMAADRWIDYNASYLFTSNDGQEIGRVGRKGAKSLLKAHYEIFDTEGNQEFLIQEENPWAKFFDALMAEIPLVGMFTGYMFNPRYVVKRADGTLVARLTKEKSFFGRRFKMEKLSDVNLEEDERMLLSIMMMALLERRRG